MERTVKYDGYHFSKSMVGIYNPYCINYAMYNNEIEPFWCRSGVAILLSKSLLKHDFDVDAEYNTSEGFIDILIKAEKYIYGIELTLNGTV